MLEREQNVSLFYIWWFIFSPAYVKQDGIVLVRMTNLTLDTSIKLRPSIK